MAYTRNEEMREKVIELRKQKPPMTYQQISEKLGISWQLAQYYGSNYVETRKLKKHKSRKRLNRAV